MASSTSSHDQMSDRPDAPRERGPVRGPRIEQAAQVRGTVVRVSGYLRPFKAQVLLLLFLIVLSGLLAVLGPYLMGQAVDQIGDPSRLARAALLLLSVYFLDWLAQISQGMIMAAVMQKVLRAMRRDLFQHLQLLSLRFFDRQPHGELMSRLTNDIEAVNQGLSQSLIQLISSLLGLLGVTVAMFMLNVRLALVAFTVVPAMALLTLFVGMRTRKGFRRLQEQMGRLSGVLEETLTGERVVQAFAQETAAVESFERDNIALRDIGMRATFLAMLMPPLMTVLKNANVAVVAGLGAWLVLRGMASVGTIVSFINYAVLFARPLRQLADLYNSVQTSLAGAERVFEIIDEQPEISDARDAVDISEVKGAVEFNHVNFSYVSGIPVLKDITISAEPGETVALVGPTGAGKTTMVNLLTRFYDVVDGAICVDGHDIRHIKKASLRQQLGIVLQDTFLFADTVMENIRYGRLAATDDECIHAAKLANADQFIDRLPQGYQTVLSERASNLSQGQRQLLAITRAVLADPGILILDEATSSVDTRTEVRIQEALLRLMQGRTSFVIAHRLSTIRRADRVLVINNGHIIERGTHKELLAKRGFYYRSFMSQFKGTYTPDMGTTEGRRQPSVRRDPTSPKLLEQGPS